MLFHATLELSPGTNLVKPTLLLLCCMVVLEEKLRGNALAVIVRGVVPRRGLPGASPAKVFPPTSDTKAEPAACEARAGMREPRITIILSIFPPCDAISDKSVSGFTQLSFLSLVGQLWIGGDRRL
jgi:hypothetical protein